jgi:hypothetical protein
MMMTVPPCFQMMTRTVMTCSNHACAYYDRTIYLYCNGGFLFCVVCYVYLILYYIIYKIALCAMSVMHIMHYYNCIGHMLLACKIFSSIHIHIHTCTCILAHTAHVFLQICSLYDIKLSVLHVIVQYSVMRECKSLPT